MEQTNSAATHYPTPPPFKSEKNKSRHLIRIITATALFIATSICALFFLSKGTVQQKSIKSDIAHISPMLSPIPTREELQGKIFSGHIEKLDKNLGLIEVYSNNTSSHKVIDNSVVYYRAGVYTAGKYKGYTRYIALGGIDSNQQGLGATIFISKDGKSFILNVAPQSYNNGTNTQSLLANFDTKKVTKIDYLDSEHSQTISLNSQSSLLKTRIFLIVDFSSTTQKDSLGNTIYPISLPTDFTNYPLLKSPRSNLTFHQQLLTPNSRYVPPRLTDADSFLSGTTTTIVLDSTGLPYLYTLASPTRIATYPKEMKEYNAADEKFQQQFKNNNYKFTPEKPFPVPKPLYPDSPSTALFKEDIQTTQPIYNHYSLAIPENCAEDPNTLVAKNVSDADLEKIGTSINGDVYVLKDKNHLLLKTEYKDKISNLANANPKTVQRTFQQANNEKPVPTLDEYVSKNPLLFFKDYWGRWIILGESDYQMPMGCGKPVIYLYPTKPTNVSIQFLTPISFDVDIPTYHNGWNVLAQPNATLTDLQPQFTSCAAIDSTKFGSEYAQSACKTNTYPYLYWAGKSTARNYPAVTQGWIISRSDVKSFIDKTLDDVGFTPTEKSDFTSYWIPQMMSHSEPYFRISFLQNQEMDEIAPMRITPKPDTYYRYFLDFLPLDSKIDIKPQTLTKIIRHGFTVIEWGGHLR